MKRVVITGIGIWSCLGTTLDEVRDSLYAGKSGFIFRQERKEAGFRSPLCANVPLPNLKPFVARNQRNFMPEEVADLVGFLASPSAGYITGEVVSINGGLYT